MLCLCYGDDESVLGEFCIDFIAIFKFSNSIIFLI
jgi:hypothetical protein